MKFTDDSRGVKIAKDPAVIAFKNRYYMYYTISSTEDIPGFDIGIAQSEDLENWEKIGELARIGEIEQNGICAPGAIVLNDTIHLFYQTYSCSAHDGICHAISTDGINFTRTSSSHIIRAEGSWNNGRAIDADVCIFNDSLYLYFATRDPKGLIQMLSMARTSLHFLDNYEIWNDHDAWEVYSEKPILKPEISWEQNCIEAPACLVLDGKIFMFYAGAYNNAPQQIGLAVSNDGINFERISDKPFLKNGKEGTWNSSESGHPYVFMDRDRIFLFYQGNNNQGKSWFLSKVELEYHPSKNHELPFVIK